MFTGIIKNIGIIVGIDKTRGDTRFIIQCDTMDFDTLETGASVCHEGCCLTALNIDNQATTFAVDVSQESLDKTTLGSWNVGTKINLERSLCMGDELGGHLVSGHVDGVARLESIVKEGDSHRLKFKVPFHLARFVAPKGSVALDGISLTVNEVEGNIFGVNIIPHTCDVTTLGDLKVGDELNLEVDMMARYAARLSEYAA
jgi:riboflavin synthase